MAEVDVKATFVLHNILTVPGDAVLNEVVEQHVSIFDDAFEEPGQGPAAVHEYVKDYFNSYYGSVPWQNEAACVTQNKVLNTCTCLK